MKLLLLSLISLGACNLPGSSSPAPVVPAPAPAGVFHPGPYTDPDSGKSCSAPGGFCDADKACHSDAAHCK